MITDVWLRRRSDGATLPMPIGVEQSGPWVTHGRMTGRLAPQRESAC